MSVGLTEAQLRAKDLQIENLQLAANINEETITNLKNDVSAVNEKVEKSEKANKAKIEELTKENIACTYKLTVLEKVRKIELARVSKSSGNSDHEIKESKEQYAAQAGTEVDEVVSDQPKIDQPNENILSPKPVTEELQTSTKEEITNNFSENANSETTKEEIEEVAERRKFTDESMHVLVAKIVGLEKEKEASLEKIESLQSLIDSMYEREKK